MNSRRQNIQLYMENCILNNRILQKNRNFKMKNKNVSFSHVYCGKKYNKHFHEKNQQKLFECTYYIYIYSHTLT